MGIGGDVGKGLGFVDSLLPGGSVFTDIAGGPGGAVFGKAIKDWKDANSETVQKLGATNDETVRNLIGGLGRVQTDLNKGLEQNVLLLSDELGKSITSLDQSLKGSLDRLDSSLTNQTARLDTIFQKQTSALFQFGQILLTVLVLAGAFYATARTLTPTDAKPTVTRLIAQSIHKIALVLAVAALFIAGAWFWPDPSQASKRRSDLVAAYAKSMAYEDYLGGSTSASQLAILAPADALTRSYELKSRAFRELFFRPTVQLTRGDLLEVMHLMVSADRWRIDATKHNDPEIASALALASLQSFDSNYELMRAVGLLRGAANAFGAPGSHQDIEPKITEEGTTKQSLSRWRESNRRLVSAVADLHLEPEMLRLGLPNIPVDKTKLLEDEFVPQSLAATPGGGGEPSAGYSPIRDLSDAVVNKIEVAKFYRVILSHYFDHVAAVITKAAPPDVVEPSCRAFRYAAEWHETVFARRAASQSFVVALLAGPSVVLDLMKTSLGDKNPCAGLSDTSFQRFSTARKYWNEALFNAAVGASEKSGASRFEKLAEGIAENQKQAFTAFEKMSSELTTSVEAGSADKSTKLAEWLDAATVLGLHASSSDSKLKPALIWVRGQQQRLGSLSSADTQRIAFRYLFAPVY